MLSTSDYVVSQRHARRRSQTEKQQTQTDVAASYSRMSSSQQREASIEGQQRKCQDAAKLNGHEISQEHEFSDAAVSGTKLMRAGLNQMLAAAEQREFSVLYVYSLSRLARESVITLPMLKRLVHTFEVRVISVTEGLDSSRDGWEVIAMILSMIHERYVKELSQSVLRGQEDTILGEFSVGDWCLGYGSEAVPGSEQSRRGRNSKPRMKYVVDDETVIWVIRVFHWFVVENRSIGWIVGELNRNGAPKDHRSKTSEWHHQLVVNLLMREKYVGIWPWGEMQNKRDPETGKITQVSRPVEESSKWTRHFPHLQVISGEIFQKAQERLKANQEKWKLQRKANGQLQGSSADSNGRTSRRLLHNLVCCSACGSPFRSTGKRMRCRGNARKTCDVETSVKNEVIEGAVLAEIGELIANDSEWFDLVYQRLVENWQAFQNRVPANINEKEKELSAINLRIARLLDSIEAGNAPPEVNSRLNDRQAEKAIIVRELDDLQRENRNSIAAPTREWLRSKIQELANVLSDSIPPANAALQELINGKISLEQVPTPHRKCFHFRARFTLTLRTLSQALGIDIDCQNPDHLKKVTEIDLLESTEADEQREMAKALYDEGMLERDIAKTLGVSRSRVTHILTEWYERRGENKPDGRARRHTLEKPQETPPKYQLIADNVMQLMEQGKLIAEVASQLGVDRNTVTKSIKFWHESRGLPVPDGRTRRKALTRKSRTSH